MRNVAGEVYQEPTAGFDPFDSGASILLAGVESHNNIKPSLPGIPF